MKYMLSTHRLILYYAHELLTVDCQPKYTQITTVGDMLHAVSCKVNYGYLQWVAWLDMSVLSFQ